MQALLDGGTMIKIFEKIKKENYSYRGIRERFHRAIIEADLRAEAEFLGKKLK